MLTVISPAQFKSIPWKNGKGTTLELAINHGATLADFDWRLSIASVVENGAFSDFSGYQRNLILIEGNGITLNYTGANSHSLEQLLSFASFDGAWQTSGELHAGPIKDFNLISRWEKYRAEVTTWQTKQVNIVKPATINFVFSPSEEIEIKTQDGAINVRLPIGHLAQISENTASLIIKGAQVISIELHHKTELRVCDIPTNNT